MSVGFLSSFHIVMGKPPFRTLEPCLIVLKTLSFCKKSAARLTFFVKKGVKALVCWQNVANIKESS